MKFGQNQECQMVWKFHEAYKVYEGNKFNIFFLFCLTGLYNP